MTKVKITADDLRIAEGALSEMDRAGIKFNSKTSYWLARNTDKIEREVKVLSKIRNELITKYGTPDDISGQVTVQQFIDKTDAEGNVVMAHDVEGNPTHPEKIINPAIAEFSKEWDDVVAQEIEIEITMIKVDDLVDSKRVAVDIKPNLLKGIAFMLEE